MFYDLFFIIYSFFQIFDYNETGQKTTAIIRTAIRRRTARPSLAPLEEDRCTNDHVSTLSGLGAGTGLWSAASISSLMALSWLMEHSVPCFVFAVLKLPTSGPETVQLWIRCSHSR